VQSLFLVEADKESLLLQRSIREKIELTEEDKEKVEFVILKDENEKPYAFNWEKDKDTLFEPEFSPSELVYLNKRAMELEKNKKLVEGNLDLAINLEEAVK
jgi:hypothetical protein